MALYPDAQKKAQEELDLVVGTERLPEFSDRPSLPYIDALVKELFRWHSGTPIGFPHRVVADDEYNGYIIPKNATVFVNMWSVPCSGRTCYSSKQSPAFVLTGRSCGISRCTLNPSSSCQTASWMRPGT